jgi:hypothetical protein
MDFEFFGIFKRFKNMPHKARPLRMLGRDRTWILTVIFGRFTVAAMN